MERSGIPVVRGVFLREVWWEVETDKMKLRADMGTLETE